MPARWLAAAASSLVVLAGCAASELERLDPRPVLVDATVVATATDDAAQAPADTSALPAAVAPADNPAQPPAVTPTVTPTPIASPTPTPTPRVALRELAGQLVVTAIRRGAAPSPALLRNVRLGRVSGVIVADTSARDPRPITRALQAAARAGKRPPALVAVDQEGGAVRRLSDAQPVRSARSLGRGHATTTEQVARAAGCQLRRRGITLDLAPVADAATAPAGFIAATDRAFALTAAEAAPHVAAFVRGLRTGGVGATLKHFPGLGSATANTDLDTRRATPEPGSIAAFEAGIAAGADSVMISSATYASGPFATGLPAVLSQDVIARLRGLSFDGVVITDDLVAPGPRTDPRFAGAAVRAVRAGVDLLLFVDADGHAASQAREALVAAVQRGELSRDRLLDAYRRVTALKAAVAELVPPARCPD